MFPYFQQWVGGGILLMLLAACWIFFDHWRGPQPIRVPISRYIGDHWLDDLERRRLRYASIAVMVFYTGAFAAAWGFIQWMLRGGTTSLMF